MASIPLSVSLDDEQGELIIVDQTLLPAEVRFLRLRTVEQVWEAIRSLRVRGAPAIGIAAAFGVYLAVRHSEAATAEDIAQAASAAVGRLASARPTAVNLFWALRRMEQRLAAACLPGCSRDAVLAALRDEAQAIRDEDAAMCRSIGEYALSLLQPGWGLLTHCNAGALATAEYGTALAPIYLGQERGYGFHVFADETRPLFQGARLTAWELLQAGVHVTLICDNMAATVMKRGWIQAVLVGCDRVAANGDVANKIGTLGVAVLARRFGIPFYVCAPSSTIDLECPSGDSIVIEERDGKEITSLWYARSIAPEGVGVFNPAFDVTDAELVTAIITEKGIVRPPFGESLSRLMQA
ncbi:MAG: S-methyl-5-thioribose-1-phosphate isomerase [Spirochaetales bacterium]|nr:S-methyl-5-thioribose-1-phosphate isomerase [Spirochaetales bacterium]